MELIGSRPDRKVIIYFALTILIGTGLLMLPVSAANNQLRLVDALFTSTSAVCVTGLTVLDTGHDFSLFGQIVILTLIQLGGLGIMTFASILLVTVVPRLSLRDRLVISQTLGGGQMIRPMTLLKAVALSTFIIELIGAGLLFLKFRTQFPIGEAVFHSIFHAVSAFCNAGFSTFSTSLEYYSGNFYVISVFSILIICGGLGFVVIGEIVSRFAYKSTRVSLHTKLCLSMTVVLLLIGTLAFMLADYGNVFGDMNFGWSLVNAFFQAVTCRTAGFNTIPQANLTEVSLLVTMILMFIGACPGSTGGGVKTTTIAIIFLLAYNRFRGRISIRAFKKTISHDSVIKALTVIVAAATIIAIMFVLFMFAEEHTIPHRLSHGWFIESLFEMISAFGTVGLSLGITGGLHDFGKVLIILLMFIGRVGLLTLVFALAREPKKGEIVYIEEQVMVG
nr:hypothetical protein [candidate division Zixibacteria bacterium]